MIVHIENGKVINKINNLLSDGMYVSVYENKASLVNFCNDDDYYQCIALGIKNYCYHSRTNDFNKFLKNLECGSLYYFESLEEFAETVLEKKWKFENYGL